MTASYRNIKNSASKNYVTYELPEDLPLSNIIQGTLAFVKSVSSLYVYDSGWQPIQLSNEVPTLDNVPPATVSIPIGGSYSIDLAATDPDGLPISWSYEVIGGSLSINTLTLNQNTFSFGALDDTSFTIRFSASDSVNTTTSETAFTITNEPPSAPTIIDGITDLSATYINPTTINNYQLNSVDPEGAVPTFTATQTSGDTVLNSAILNNTLSLSIDYDATPATFDITASDGKYTNTSNISIQPEIQNFNLTTSTADVVSSTDSTANNRWNADLYKDRYIASIDVGNSAKIWLLDGTLGQMNLEATLQRPPLVDLPGTATGEYGFAADVQINDDVAYVSAPGNYFYEPTPETDPIVPGRVDIWTRTGTTWSYASSIVSPTGITQNDAFGIAISLDRFNNRLCVCASGSRTLHVYNISGSTLTLESTIDVDSIVTSDTGVAIGAFGADLTWKQMRLRHDRNRIAITDNRKVCILARYDNEGTITWKAEPIRYLGANVNTQDSIEYKAGSIGTGKDEFDLEDNTLVLADALNGYQMSIYELQEGIWTRVLYLPEGGEGTSGGIRFNNKSADSLYIKLRGSNLVMIHSYRRNVFQDGDTGQLTRAIYRKAGNSWATNSLIFENSISTGTGELLFSKTAMSHDKLVTISMSVGGFSVAQSFKYYQSTN